jgi:hypothetical protein
MVDAAVCPRCNAPLDETSFLAQAPQCTHCGVLVTEYGGTLGMTSAYGVNDPNLTRDRVESDLRRLQEAESRYRGMIYAHQAQLGWGPEHYAKLPPAPELLQAKEAPSFLGSVMAGALGGGCLWFLILDVLFAVFSTALLYTAVSSHNALLHRLAFRFGPNFWHNPGSVVGPMVLLALVLGIISGLAKFLKGAGANSKIQAENAYRQRKYEKAKAAAVRVAIPEKEKADHIMRREIVKLEGFLKNTSQQEAHVRRILTRL